MDETDQGSQAARADAGDGPQTPDLARRGGWWAAFVRWSTLATRSRGPRWPGMPPIGPRLRLTSLVAGALSAIMILGSIAFSVLDEPPGDSSQPRSSPSGPPSPQQIAGEIGARADELGRSTDPLTVLQLRLAAHTVDPASAQHRAALAQLLLGPRPLSTLTTSVGEVTSVAFDGNDRLAVGGREGVQEASGEPTHMSLGQPAAGELADVSAVAYQSSELWVAAATGVHAAAAPTDGSAEAVHALVRLGATGWAATTRDGRLVAWDAAAPSGAPNRILADGLGSAAPLTATADGQYMFTPSAGGVAVRDAATGQVVTSITADGPVSAISVDAAGRRLLVGHGDRASLFDLTDGGAPTPAATISHPGGNVSVAALAPDGRTAVTAGGGITAAWELPAGAGPTLLATLPVGSATALAYSPDSRILATGSGSAVDVWSVAELLVYRPAEIQAAVKLSSQLGVEPVTFAALNSDGSYIVTGGAPTEPGYVWSTRRAWTEDPVLEYHSTLDGPIRSAHAVGQINNTTVVSVGLDGQATQWLVTSPTTIREGRLTSSAEAAAVTPDAKQAVTVTGTEGTVWGLGLDRGAKGTLSYPSPTTALAFASRGTALIGGHADGSVTVHTIDLRYENANRRHLNSNDEDSPVNAVALSGNANVAMAVHENGTITIWDLTRIDTDAGISVSSAVAAGPHQTWLSLTGDFAVISDTGGATSLWSLVDRSAPAMLANIIAGETTLPVAVSGDGSTALQLTPGNNLVLWNLQPVLGLADDPTPRACELAKFTHERWREIVADPNLNTPCLPPPVPDLDDPEPPSG